MRVVQEKAFKTAVILILAGLTVLTSLIFLFNVLASSRVSSASRDSRILSIRYLTHLGRSLWETASERELMVAAQETAGLLLLAEAYEKMSRDQAAFLYRLTGDRLKELKDLLAAQGRITRPPYHNPQTGLFDSVQYFLDEVYIPAAELLERQEQKRKESDFWGRKGDTFTTGLAVMAVAVFLLTLSLVLSGKVRLAMAGVGLALVAAVAGTSILAAARSWRPVSSRAVKELARATGQVLRAKLILDYSGDVQTAARFTGPAEMTLDAILAENPGYGTALEARARLRTTLGESLFFAGKIKEGRAEMERTVADLDGVERAGRQDGYLDWTRGFAQLLLGRFSQAEASVERALARLPRQGLALGLLKAVILLYEGRRAASQAAVEDALSQAVHRPLASDSDTFRIVIRNLERFRAIMPANGLKEMERRLKEASVLIALDRGTRPPRVTASVARIRFINLDPQGEVIDLPERGIFPAGTGHAYFLLEFKDMRPGQSLVRKVYRRLPGQVFWVEQLRLGRSEHWRSQATEARVQGSVEYPMPEAGEYLVSGHYRLEVYIEGNLKASETFLVQ